MTERLERVARVLAQYNHENPDEPTVLRWSETNKFKRVSSPLEEGPTWKLYMYEAMKAVAVFDAATMTEDEAVAAAIERINGPEGDV